MSYPKSSRQRQLIRVAASLAAAAAVLVPSLADGTIASAGGFEPPPIDLPKIDRPILDSKIPITPFDPVPLPCLGWWCTTPSIFLQPDYVASFDNISSETRTYDGEIATPYYVTIYNKGFSNPGDVYSTIAARGGKVLAIEGVHTAYPDLQTGPVSDTATTSAPFAVSFLDDAWIVHDTDGYDVGYSNRRYLRVWVTGTGDAELVVRVNEHVGADLLGSPGLAGYRRAEITRSNNTVEFTV